MKKTLCLVGKSGTGKTTIANKLKEHGFSSIDSFTTRPRRFENEGGHIFVSPKEFDALRGDLVAYTMFDGYEYGATKQQFEKNDVYIIDPAGIYELIENVGRENLIIVYITALDGIRYERMKKQRGVIQAFERIKHDEVKFAAFTEFDIALENNSPSDLERNIKRLMYIMNIGRLNESNE
ncbi:MULTISPECIES: AAA family ATPase [Bacillus]|uniref:AAA family ATPase n=1 Tax=Bacillus TaxID=1386 RepID=UPI0009B77ED3|nr:MULTISPECIES: AAA family ATPase [Bacillus]ARC72599.1 guanylate kinase [Bacillus licheniformis]ARW56584.1 Guanylate kinase [Bacillus licheniformis]AXF87853.1 hypothetical protein BLDA23_06010 [Bacillus licheniformis]KAA6475811.1 hypothetical protein DX928_06815 [Bacillus swezeyi]